MDLSLLKTFLEVARTRHFGEAGQMVQQELAEGVPFPVADAPVIERAAFALYRPGIEKRDPMQLALRALRRVGVRP